MYLFFSILKYKFKKKQNAEWAAVNKMTILLVTIYTRIYQPVTMRNHNITTAVERPVKDYWGLKLVLLDLNSCSLFLRWFETFGPYEGFLIFQ